MKKIIKMINFSKISKGSVFGSFLRFVLLIIPHNFVVSVVQGPLKGYKWIKGSGVNGYWLGTYELGFQKIFLNKVKEGDIFFDIGAHVGFYSLLGSKLVGEKGKIFSFEPSPRNFTYLKKHIELNKSLNIIPAQKAVMDHPGSFSFDLSEGSFVGHIVNNENKSMKIEAVSLDTFCEEKNIIPTVMKIDVEGAEADVFRGAQRIIETVHPKIFLAIHSAKLAEECENFLVKRGYSISRIEPENSFNLDIYAERIITKE
jgi:FkbM family methyltransferase